MYVCVHSLACPTESAWMDDTQRQHGFWLLVVILKQKKPEMLREMVFPDWGKEKHKRNLSRPLSAERQMLKE